MFSCSIYQRWELGIWNFLKWPKLEVLCFETAAPCTKFLLTQTKKCATLRLLYWLTRRRRLTLNARWPPRQILNLMCDHPVTQSLRQNWCLEMSNFLWVWRKCKTFEQNKAESVMHCCMGAFDELTLIKMISFLNLNCLPIFQIICSFKYYFWLCKPQLFHISFPLTMNWDDPFPP